MMLDATQSFAAPLTADRLFGWHAALFPTGRSGMRKITVRAWRDDATGPMQVVSGPVGKERVHYAAPAAPRLPNEMAQFLEWGTPRPAVRRPATSRQASARGACAPPTTQAPATQAVSSSPQNQA